MRKLLVLALAAAALLPRCSLAADTLPLSTAPVALSPAERSNAAGFRFIAGAGETKGNTLFSPYGLYSAFSMAYDCARGNTASEIRSVFSFPEDADSLRREAVLLRRGLIKSVKGLRFRRINAFWYQKGYEFLPEYEAVLKSSYSASGETADFRSSPEKARAAINDWTGKKTDGLITGVFEQGALTLFTRLMLANAVTFKGNWASSFNKDLTSEQDFSLAGGEKAKAQLMTSDKPLKTEYYEDEEFQAAGLDYLGGKLRMLVLLPAEGKSAADLYKNLTPEKLSELRKAMSARIEPVLVTLPRFKISGTWDLAARLSALGMPGAFKEDADYSGMTGRKGLFLQQAVQKVVVEVDEAGREAPVVKTRKKKREKAPLLFKADRPFIFLIEEKRTGLLLFLGKLEDPSLAV